MNLLEYFMLEAEQPSGETIYRGLRGITDELLKEMVDRCNASGQIRFTNGRPAVKVGSFTVDMDVGAQTAQNQWWTTDRNIAIIYATTEAVKDKTVVGKTFDVVMVGKLPTDAESFKIGNKGVVDFKNAKKTPIHIMKIAFSIAGDGSADNIRKLL